MIDGQGFELLKNWNSDHHTIILFGGGGGELC
jgi:hypothetical protein